jgi:hypothetical protein
MLVCALFCAHCTRDRGCSAHPAFPAPSIFRGRRYFQNLGRMRRENAKPYLNGPPSLRGALATKQSILSLRRAMDCFASLAMTEWVGPLENYYRRPNPYAQLRIRSRDPYAAANRLRAQVLNTFCKTSAATHGSRRSPGRHRQDTGVSHVTPLPFPRSSASRSVSPTPSNSSQAKAVAANP